MTAASRGDPSSGVGPQHPAAGGRAEGLLPFPPPRLLVAWWRLLAPHQPVTLWVGHLFLHRLEALAALEHSTPLDPLAQVLLNALDLEVHATTGEGPVLPRMQQRLGIDSHLLQRWLQRLEEAEVVRHLGPGTWELTGAGRQALEQGSIRSQRRERRSFTFLDPRPLTGPAGSPFFVALETSWVFPWLEGKDWPMNPAQLCECPRQPLEWKERTSFPLDVIEVLTPLTDDADPAQEWEQAIVDRPGRLTIAICHCGGSEAGWRCFAVQPDSWDLDTKPALTLTEEMLPLLGIGALPLDAHQEAWRQWVTSHGWSAAEADACQLQLAVDVLRVTPPPELRERVAEALKTDGCLLVGAGALRQATRVEMV